MIEFQHCKGTAPCYDVDAQDHITKFQGTAADGQVYNARARIGFPCVLPPYVFLFLSFFISFLAQYEYVDSSTDDDNRSYFLGSAGPAPTMNDISPFYEYIPTLCEPDLIRHLFRG